VMRSASGGHVVVVVMASLPLQTELDGTVL
jgi:hypothetical protein